MERGNIRVFEEEEEEEGFKLVGRVLFNWTKTRFNKHQNWPFFKGPISFQYSLFVFSVWLVI
jgi:hypothetical protein